MREPISKISVARRRDIGLRRELIDLTVPTAGLLYRWLVRYAGHLKFRT
jgi:hypothetical protein